MRVPTLLSASLIAVILGWPSAPIESGAMVSGLASSAEPAVGGRQAGYEAGRAADWVANDRGSAAQALDRVPALAATRDPRTGVDDAPVFVPTRTPTRDPRAGADDAPLLVPTRTPTRDPRAEADEPLMLVPTRTPTRDPRAAADDSPLRALSPTPTRASLTAVAQPGSAATRAPLDTGVQNLFTANLSVYGQSAVLHWRAPSSALITVDYGTSSALGRHAVENPSPAAAPMDVVDHQVHLDGLQTGGLYYYRATLLQGGRVLDQTQTLSFRTPHAVVQVRPLRIDMAKDGDSDWWFIINAGEVYIEWQVQVSPAPQGNWPGGPVVKGCYPGGGRLRTNLPPLGEPKSPGAASTPSSGDDTSYDPTTGAQTPALHGDPGAWAPYAGCHAYRYDATRTVDSATVGSGGAVELQPEGYAPLSWPLPDGMPGQPGPSSGPGPGLPLMPQQDEDEDLGPTGSPPAPCGSAVPPGTFALARAGVRGQEFDTVPGIDLRIVNHDVRGWNSLCLDLREPRDTVMFAVTADDGHFKFTVWFQAELNYQ